MMEEGEGIFKRLKSDFINRRLMESFLR